MTTVPGATRALSHLPMGLSRADGDNLTDDLMSGDHGAVIPGRVRPFYLLATFARVCLSQWISE